MLMNVLLTTGILWTLSALVVIPLAQAWLGTRLQEPQYAHLGNEGLSQPEQEELQRLADSTYIICDVVVLGLAGFFGGLVGYWFIGLAFESKGWPGMLAFIGASYLGVNL